MRDHKTVDKITRHMIDHKAIERDERSQGSSRDIERSQGYMRYRER